MPGHELNIGAPQVYRMSPVRRVILDGVALALLALPAAILISNPAAARVALLFVLLLSPTLFILLFSAWYPRLIVSTEGLRVRGAIGYASLLIPWNNIERVWLRAALRKNTGFQAILESSVDSAPKMPNAKTSRPSLC